MIAAVIILANWTDNFNMWLTLHDEVFYVTPEFGEVTDLAVWDD